MLFVLCVNLLCVLDSHTYLSLSTGMNMTGSANEARRASLMGIACAFAWGVTVFIGLNSGRNVWAQVI